MDYFNDENKKELTDEEEIEVLEALFLDENLDDNLDEEFLPF